MTVGSRWVYRVTDMADGSTKRQVITVTRVHGAAGLFERTRLARASFAVTWS